MKTKVLSMASCLCVLLLALVLCIGVPNAKSATEEDIENAIEKGLAWLATQQQGDGSWQYTPGVPNLCVDVGTTGLVVLKFEERAKELGLDPFDTDPASATYYEYAGNVIAGLDYIFSNAIKDGEDRVYFGCLSTYSTAIAMMAVAASNAPDREITTGALNTWTYQQALQGMMDWMVYAQQRSILYACDEGGWAYYDDPEDYNDWADQSNTGYATIGLGYAAAAPPKGFGLTIPEDVLTRLKAYIEHIQAASGGSMYEPCYPHSWINILKTGNLLYEMALVGDEVTDTRVQNAISYIENHWNDTGVQPEFPSTSLGWKDAYQAMFTMMKGLEAFGIKTITVGGLETNWFDKVSDVIVTNQNLDGSWAQINTTISEGEESANLRAAWAMLTLERVVPTVGIKVYVDIKPGSCPNPLNLKSKGVLPVAVLGTEDFDVTTIDPETIRLSREGIEKEVAPLRWSCEDVATPFEGDLCDCHELGADGYMDLTLKFETQEVVDKLELDDVAVAGETIPLTLTGNLKEEFGGTPIEGQDCVWVLDVPKGKQ